MEPAVAPYPTHWEADVLLRDGATMRIRPIRPTDADALQAFHVGQSEESTYFRFFAPMRRLSDRDLTRLVTVDHHERVALVVVSGEAIIAVGRYDRVDEAHAEVAFNVSDAHQGRGLGSVLLEHLAAAARERGVSVFVADVLPGNAKMIRVFQDAGYEVAQRYEDGVISLEFTISPTQRSLEVVASREQRTDAASMRAFLTPRRILVLAGSSAGELAARVADNLAGHDGVTCVGAALREVAGRVGHAWAASLEQVPGDAGPAELAVVAAAPREVVDAFPRLAALGVRGAVVLSEGFVSDPDPGAVHEPGHGSTPASTPASTPDGAAPSQRELLRAARAAGVRLVGPRSFGVLTRTEEGVVDATLWPHVPPPGGVALFCQSGALALELMDLVTDHGLGVAAFLSAGHRADVSGNDLLQYAVELPGLRAVGLYLESLGNPRKFARVVSRVSATAPVVAVVGASERETRQDALGRGAVEEAMLAAGVLVAPTMRAMVQATQLFAHRELPRGRRVAVLGNSVSVAELAVAQVAHLDPEATLHVLPWSADGAAFGAAVDTLAAQEDWDAALVLYSPPLSEPDPAVLAAIARLGQGERPVLAVVHGLLGVTPELTGTQGRTVPAYECVEDAVGALTLAHRYAHWRRTDHGALVTPEGVDLRKAREAITRLLDGVGVGEQVELPRREVRRLLGSFGIEVLRTRIVGSTTEALAAAHVLGWPLVVKSTDRALRHRADLGGIRFDVSGPLELVEAIRQVRQRQGGRGKVELQPMVPLGVACLVRGWVDRVLGPVVSFGLAGDATEWLGDAGYAMPPLRSGDVHRLVHSVRAAPRLVGTAERAGVDVAALEDLVARVADAMDSVPQLQRLELRPALASPDGVTVLDAAVVLAAEVRPDGARRALRG